MSDLSEFDPKMFKPVSFIPSERRVLVEFIPEEVELRNTASGSVLPVPGSSLVNPAGHVIPTTAADIKPHLWWEKFTMIPRHDIIQRPSGTALKYRKAVVVAVNEGVYQMGKHVPSNFNVGEIVIADINAREMVFFTDENAWKSDASGRIKDRELFVFAEHTIIGKVTK